MTYNYASLGALDIPRRGNWCVVLHVKAQQSSRGGHRWLQGKAMCYRFQHLCGKLGLPGKTEHRSYCTDVLVRGHCCSLRSGYHHTIKSTLPVRSARSSPKRRRSQPLCVLIVATKQMALDMKAYCGLDLGLISFNFLSP